MISDSQVLRLFDLVRRQGVSITIAAAKSRMSAPTARKYLRLDKLPSEIKKDQPTRSYLTRPDAFARVWLEVEDQLETNPKIQAKELFLKLQKKYPGRFKPSQLRTFQRRVKKWKDNPPKEVFFEQVRQPGQTDYVKYI